MLVGEATEERVRLNNEIGRCDGIGTMGAFHEKYCSKYVLEIRNGFRGRGTSFLTLRPAGRDAKGCFTICLLDTCRRKFRQSYLMTF